jgi:hypothetical protein
VEWFLAMAGARETETEATMEGRKWRARGREKISGGGDGSSGSMETTVPSPTQVSVESTASVLRKTWSPD